MAAYVIMRCDRCKREQERYSNARFCSCGGRVVRVPGVPADANDFQVATGEVVRRARRKLGLTAAEMARRAGLAKSFVSDVENGKRGISLENWYRLASALGGRYTALLGEIVRLCRELQEA